MSKRRRLALIPFTALLAALLLAGPPALADSEPRATTSKSKHKKGKYQGKVGTFARIIIRTNRNKVKRLDAGVQASCQRASDGTITKIELLAMRTTSAMKIRRNGKFKGEGQTDDGVAWEIKGRFFGRKRAKGTFEASYFRTVFNPFVPFDSELCAGSGKWTAKLK